MSESLVYDWANHGPYHFQAPSHIAINDETLREGLQSPSVTEPPIESKIRILHLMERLGIETASLGIPCAGARQFEDAVSLCREIATARMNLRPSCGGRTLISDVQRIVDVCSQSGVRADAFLFTGSSPVRQIVEQWSISEIVQRSREAIAFAVREGLDAMYITEDTTRSSPEQLKLLLTNAVEAGAARVCLCDTAGAATVQATMNLVSWARAFLPSEVGIDWHGHNDRGLGMANALAAIHAGAERIHATALGLGERTGNTAMEQLLANLYLLNLRTNDLSVLPEYIDTIANSFHVSVPVNTPVVGRDAFRTATGVHAAAVAKALDRGDRNLADLVYSGVPASAVGRTQEIEVGQLSGASNVRHYLASHGLSDTPEVVQAVLALAKRSSRVLTDKEILDVVQSQSKRSNQ